MLLSRMLLWKSIWWHLLRRIRIPGYFSIQEVPYIVVQRFFCFGGHRRPAGVRREEVDFRSPLPRRRRNPVDNEPGGWAGHTESGKIVTVAGHQERDARTTRRTPSPRRRGTNGKELLLLPRHGRESRNPSSWMEPGAAQGVSFSQETEKEAGTTHTTGRHPTAC